MTNHRITFCIAFSIVLLLAAACSKQSEFSPDSLEKNIISLTGSNGAYTGWQLCSVVINNVSQPTNAATSSYQKHYNLNGAYTDTDGLKGNWKMYKDSLSEAFISPSNTANITSQAYKVTKITDSQLVLEYCVNTKKITLFFSAFK